EFRTGERLPAERDLASDLGVSRAAVREALDILARSGVVARRPGSGSFVIWSKDTGGSHEPGSPVAATGLPPVGAASPLEPAAAYDILAVSEATSLLELQVVRGIVEPELVRLAVIHMAPRDITRLSQRLADAEAVLTDAEAFARVEEEFFLDLARATGNPLLIAIYQMITDVRRQGHWLAHKRKSLSPSRIREYQKRLRSLFEAIERRDPETAVEYAKLQLFDEQRMLMREA
ncbi:MAG: FCD domain-containing protein, partial [Hyphomicrobiaceae bacterium]